LAAVQAVLQLPQVFQDAPPRPLAPLLNEAAKKSVAGLGDGDCDENRRIYSKPKFFLRARKGPYGIAAGSNSVPPW